MTDSANSPPPGLSPNPFRVSLRTILILLIFGSIALRMWGLDFGLPQVFHPDEPVVVTRAQYGAATNDWNPRGFHWPSLQIYIVGFEYKVWYWVGQARGIFETEEFEEIPSSDKFIAYALRAPSGFYYLGRLTTVLFCAGVVWLTFLLARRFFPAPVALCAAALVAIHPIMVRQGRYVTPDIPAEFFFLAALLLIDRLHSTLSHPAGGDVIDGDTPGGNPMWLMIFAALMIGLGTGTKYPVSVLGIPLAAVMLFAPSRFGFIQRILLALAAAAIVVVTFFATTPFALLDWEKFLTDIRTIGWHVRTGHIGMEATGGIWLASLSRLVADSGWAWTVAGAVGLICFLLGALKRTWPIAIALVFVLVGLAPLDVFSDRYLVPLIPLWAIGFAWLIDHLVSKTNFGKNRLPPMFMTLVVVIGCSEAINKFLPDIGIWAVSVVIGAGFFWLLFPGISRGKPTVLPTAAILAILAVGGRGLYVSCNEAYHLTLPDTRELALEWVEENIPPHSVIVTEQGGPDINSHELVPLMPEPWYFVEEITPLFFRGGSYQDPLDRLLNTSPEWVITSSRVRDRYMREGAEEEFPGLVAVFRMYYQLIDDYLAEEARFTSNAHVVGPEIVVYRVPEGFWGTVRIEEVTVSEALERELGNSNGE